MAGTEGQIVQLTSRMSRGLGCPENKADDPWKMSTVSLKRVYCVMERFYGTLKVAFPTSSVLAFCVSLTSIRAKPSMVVTSSTPWFNQIPPIFLRAPPSPNRNAFHFDNHPSLL